MDLKSNKKIGNNFEKELAQMLREKGFWVTLLAPKNHIGSQPADLIAIKDNKATLIDCKVCNSYLFPLRRIEQNQWNASKRYFKCGNTDYFIAIKYENDIYMIPIDTINKEQKSIDLKLQMKWK